jgi:hypothetical protein
LSSAHLLPCRAKQWQPHVLSRALNIRKALRHAAALLLLLPHPQPGSALLPQALYQGSGGRSIAGGGWRWVTEPVTFVVIVSEIG